MNDLVREVAASPLAWWRGAHVQCASGCLARITEAHIYIFAPTMLKT